MRRVSSVVRTFNRPFMALGRPFTFAGTVGARATAAYLGSTIKLAGWSYDSEAREFVCRRTEPVAGTQAGLMLGYLRMLTVFLWIVPLMLVTLFVRHAESVAVLLVLTALLGATIAMTLGALESFDEHGLRVEQPDGTTVTVND